MKLLLMICALGLGIGAATIENKLTWSEITEMQFQGDHKAQILKILAFDFNK